MKIMFIKNTPLDIGLDKKNKLKKLIKKKTE